VVKTQAESKRKLLKS